MECIPRDVSFPHKGEGGNIWNNLQLPRLYLPFFARHRFCVNVFCLRKQFPSSAFLPSFLPSFQVPPNWPFVHITKAMIFKVISLACLPATSFEEASLEQEGGDSHYACLSLSEGEMKLGVFKTTSEAEMGTSDRWHSIYNNCAIHASVV